MVRFSDMLGGADDSNARPATSMPLDEIADAVPEPEPELPENEPGPGEPELPEDESPQAVLDRLTQYAAEHGATPEPPAPDPRPTLEPVGDDLLPRAKRGRRA